MKALQQYGQAVYKATDDYLGTLQDADLGDELDLSALGFGTMSRGQLFSLLLSNVNWHTVEIACLKGLQGAIGYPF